MVISGRNWPRTRVASGRSTRKGPGHRRGARTGLPNASMDRTRWRTVRAAPAERLRDRRRRGTAREEGLPSCPRRSSARPRRVAAPEATASPSPPETAKPGASGTIAPGQAQDRRHQAGAGDAASRDKPQSAPVVPLVRPGSTEPTEVPPGVPGPAGPPGAAGDAEAGTRRGPSGPAAGAARGVTAAPSRSAGTWSACTSSRT